MYVALVQGPHTAALLETSWRYNKAADVQGPHTHFCCFNLETLLFQEVNKAADVQGPHTHFCCFNLETIPNNVYVALVHLLLY